MAAKKAKSEAAAAEVEETNGLEEEAMRIQIPMITEAETPTIEDKAGVMTVCIPGLHAHHPFLM